MDTEAAQRKPVTYLRVPFNGETIRCLPIESRHAVALNMSKHIKANQARFDVFVGLLAALLHDDDYIKVLTALSAKGATITETDVFGIFKSAVDATAKYNARLAAEANQDQPAETVAGE